MAVVRVLAIVALALTAACTSDSPASAPPAAASSASPMSCTSSITNSALPTWARTGFTPPDVPVRHVEGERGLIVGVVFGYPLSPQPRADGGNNKILWVGKVAGGGASADLKITATLNGTSVTATRVIEGGPGPSIVDLPESGCWTFDLAWGRHRDRVAVPYAG